MEEKVIQFNEEHQLFHHGDTLMLAVSGGPDSMALLNFFASIQEEWKLTLHTLTVDHQLRGQASKNDVQYVKKFSESLGVPCQVGLVDVISRKQEQQIGTQAAARELRYNFFKEKLQVDPHAKLVLGHHQDDLVESMVMQFTKGVPLTGIPIKRKLDKHLVIRPFLGLTKEEIWQYINKHNLTPRLDESNQDDDYTRNRVRKYIVPELKKENPSIAKSLFQLQEKINEDEAYLLQMATEQFQRISSFHEGEVSFSVEGFQKLPLSLQRRAFHLILNYLNQAPLINKDYFNTFKSWLYSSKPNSRLDLMNQVSLIKAYDQCRVILGSFQSSPFKVSLSMDESKDLPMGWNIKVERNGTNYTQEKLQFICDKNHIKFPMTVRTRKNGDRIIPLGMNGHKKIKDLFIDHKIPKYLRDEWPVVVNGDGEIIWVPLLCKSHLANDVGNDFITITIDTND